MNACIVSDRITALQVANDILKDYADYCHQSADDFTSDVMTLAEGFLKWADNPDEYNKEELISDFFNNEKTSR
jgi:hypothetical protein